MSITAIAKIAKVHSKMGPSKAHRWLVCPGSQNVTAEDPESEWAAEGTRKHAVLKVMFDGLPVIAGDVIPTECGPYKVPREVVEQCQEVMDFVQMFKDSHGDWVVETETAVEIGSHVWPGLQEGECAGTCDVAAYSYDELLVLDAKFGFVQVEARKNPQLMLYALGLLAEIPFPIKWVTLCIAQPGYDGTVLFREHRMTVTEIREWALEVLPVVEEVKARSYRLQADDHACRYCPARTQCPERLKALDDATQASWMEERSMEELLPLVPRLRAICKDIEARAMADLNAGKQVRGFKVVASKSRRKWASENPTEIAETVYKATAGDTTSEDLFEQKLKSPAQVEKAVRAAALRAGKKMAVKEAKAIVDLVAYQPVGGPKLAPESDPRPALEPATWTLEDVMQATLEAGEDSNG